MLSRNFFCKIMSSYLGLIYFSYNIWKCYVLAFSIELLILHCLLSTLFVVSEIQMTDWVGKININIELPAILEHLKEVFQLSYLLIWKILLSSSRLQLKGYSLVGLPSAFAYLGVCPSVISGKWCSFLEDHKMG